MTAYLIVSSLLTFVAAILLAFSVILGGKRRNVSFGVFALSVAAWSSAYFMWQISSSAEQALYFCRLLIFGASFVPVTFFHFVSNLVGGRRSGLIRAGYALAVILAALNLTPWLVASVEPILEFPFWPKAGPAFGFFLAVFFFYTIYAWHLLFRRVLPESGPGSFQYRYILAASVIGFVGGSTNFPLWYDLHIPPVGNGLVFVYLVMMGHALSKYRLPNIHIDLLRGIAFTCLGLTIAAFFLLVIAILQNLLGQPVTSAQLLNYFLFSLIMTIFSIIAVPRLMSGAERLLEQSLLRGGSDRIKLKDLAQKIHAFSDEEKIFSEAAAAITSALGPGRVGIFYRHELEREFILRAGSGCGVNGARPAIADGDPLIELLRESKEPIQWGWEQDFTPHAWRRLVESRRKDPFEVAIPIFGQDYLSGVLVLGSRANGKPYSEVDVSLLEAVCLQIGLTMRSRQLERRANQTEKLISLGTLAAGLAHELRNPLVSIQTFTALLEERSSDAEFQNEFREVMQRDVKRLAAIVENVSAFAENSVVAFQPVDLAEVIEGVYNIVRPEFARAGIGFAFSRRQPGLVQGNYSQLLQVFLNLFQNAVHALDGRPDPRIWVELERREHDLPAPAIRASVIDNGSGIEPWLLPRVFDPFTTTKSTGDHLAKRGMGLGLAIVKRIVESHQGAIEVRNEPERGARFVLYFPCREAEPS